MIDLRGLSRWKLSVMVACAASAVCAVCAIAVLIFSLALADKNSKLAMTGTAEARAARIAARTQTARATVAAPAATQGAASTAAAAAPSATAGAEATAQAAVTAAATAAAACPEGDICVTVGKDEPIRVAYMMVVSGSDASLGRDTRYGVEIAIEDRGGSLLGHPIELIGEDTLCDAEGGQAAAAKLAADPKLVAVVGPSCNSEARAALPIICAQSIPIISPSNTAPDLTAGDRPADYWCYLRTAPNDTAQGAAMAQFAWEKGYKKAATCHDGGPYADKLQQAFAQEFVRLGGVITTQEIVAPTDADMMPMLTRVAATMPEFFYYPIFIAAGAQITSQAKQTPGMENVKLACADATFSTDFLRAAGDAALGMLWSSPDFSTFGGGYADFLFKYELKAGSAPPAPYHAHAYDAANIIFNAIESVAVNNGDTLIIPRQALVAAMLATANHAGITGSLTCTATGDCADPKIAFYEGMSADPATWNPGDAADSNPKKVWAYTPPQARTYQDMVVGLLQTGSEDGWRAANTASFQGTAEQLGITLKLYDSQNDLSRQVAGFRQFIEDPEVNVIVLAALETAGWDDVLKEAQAAGKLVIIEDRRIDAPDDLYATYIGSDLTEEGRKAADEICTLLANSASKNVWELVGNVGSSTAKDRGQGFREKMVGCGITITKSQAANWSITEARQVTGAWLEETRDVQAIFAHNDEMALGAIEALKQAGLKPGVDIVIVSVDATAAAFTAMLAGDLNATVESNPLLAPQVYEAALEALNGQSLPKWVLLQGGVFRSTDPNLQEIANGRSY